MSSDNFRYAFKPVMLNASYLEFFLQNNFFNIKDDVLSYNQDAVLTKMGGKELPIGYLDIKRKQYYGNTNSVEIKELGVSSYKSFKRFPSHNLNLVKNTSVCDVNKINLDYNNELYASYMNFLKTKFENTITNYLTKKDVNLKTCDMPVIILNNGSYNEIQYNFDYIISLVISLKKMNAEQYYSNVDYKTTSSNETTRNRSNNKFQMPKQTYKRLLRQTKRQSNVFFRKSSNLKSNLIKVEPAEIELIRQENIIRRNIEINGFKYVFIGYPNSLVHEPLTQILNHPNHLEILEKQKNENLFRYIEFYNTIVGMLYKDDPVRRAEKQIDTSSTIEYIESQLYKLTSVFEDFDYFYKLIVPNYFNFDKVAIDKFKMEFESIVKYDLNEVVNFHINQINTFFRYHFYIFNGANGCKDDFYPAIYSLRQINASHKELLIQFQDFIKQSLSAKYKICKDISKVSNNFIITYNHGSVFHMNVEYAPSLSNNTYIHKNIKRKITLQEIINCCDLLCENPDEEFKSYIGMPYYSVVNFIYYSPIYQLNKPVIGEQDSEYGLYGIEEKPNINSDILGKLFGKDANSKFDKKVLYFMQTFPNTCKSIIQLTQISSLEEEIHDGSSKYVYLEMDTLKYGMNEGYSYKYYARMLQDIKIIKPARKAFMGGDSSKGESYLIYESDFGSKFRGLYKIKKLIYLDEIDHPKNLRYDLLLLPTYLNLTPTNLDYLVLKYNSKKINIPNYHNYLCMLVKNIYLYIYENLKHKHIVKFEENLKFGKCILEEYQYDNCDSKISKCISIPSCITCDTNCIYEDELFYYMIYEKNIESIVNFKDDITLVVYPISKEDYHKIVNQFIINEDYNKLFSIKNSENSIANIFDIQKNIQLHCLNTTLNKILDNLEIKFSGKFKKNDYQIYLHAGNGLLFNSIHFHIRKKNIIYAPEPSNLNSINSISMSLRVLYWDNYYEKYKVNSKTGYYIGKKFLLYGKAVFLKYLTI
jgi:hypothetical protein